MPGGDLSTFNVALIGAGDLGAAMARAMIERGGLMPVRLRVATTSGKAPRLAGWKGIKVTTDPAAAAGAADITLLAVPPAMAGALSLNSPRGPVISVMAGVTLERLTRIAGHDRVIRAMSSPAAAMGLAYSPFVAGPGATCDDRALSRALLSACGLCDEVRTEDQIDVFTAITGPVPGFVAAFAEMIADYAVARGVAPNVADRAVRQLFLSSGTLLAQAAPTAAQQVRAMIDYAGTTAAGLEVMRASGMKDDLARALDASVARARTIAG
ncbi:pyrroline-5-carboxylate reductase family protein [Defluviimonas sp. SAOS-178_SWC]|uniref:pyrroline-5-carboxylate reductase family protein n=1 Tax=Defluviimonas sp. SAOS-178_SWC TaxID=3121287 RepID=UPI003221AFFC